MDLEKFCHGTLLSKVNNAVDSGPVSFAVMTVILYTKAQTPFVRLVTAFVANLFV